MSERFGENSHREEEHSAFGNNEFNREAEKTQRKEIRKMIADVLTSTLEGMGFRKTGYSLWSRHVGEMWQIVCMQRSQTDHRYYIEAGICHERDIPEGEKLDIVFCKERERIEWIVAYIEKDEVERDVDVDKKIKKKVSDIQQALDFEIPDAYEKYPEEYFVPSVSLRRAEEKIVKIKNDIERYLPLWFTDRMEHRK